VLLVFLFFRHPSRPVFMCKYGMCLCVVFCVFVFSVGVVLFEAELSILRYTAVSTAGALLQQLLLPLLSHGVHISALFLYYAYKN